MESAFLVARFLPTGRIDTSFGRHGVAAIDLHDRNEGVADLELGGSGHILAAGTVVKSAGTIRLRGSHHRVGNGGRPHAPGRNQGHNVRPQRAIDRALRPVATPLFHPLQV